MVRFIKFLVALVLLPTVVLGAGELVRLLADVLGAWPRAAFFMGGAAGYAIIHYAWYNFSRVYVFGHENG